MFEGHKNVTTPTSEEKIGMQIFDERNLITGRTNTAEKSALDSLLEGQLKKKDVHERFSDKGTGMAQENRMTDTKL